MPPAAPLSPAGGGQWGLAQLADTAKSEHYMRRKPLFKERETQTIHTPSILTSTSEWKRNLPLLLEALVARSCLPPCRPPPPVTFLTAGKSSGSVVSLRFSEKLVSALRIDDRRYVGGGDKEHKQEASSYTSPWFI